MFTFAVGDYRGILPNFPEAILEDQAVLAASMKSKLLNDSRPLWFGAGSSRGLEKILGRCLADLLGKVSIPTGFGLIKLPS
jgi:hypothetical protein